MRYLIFSDVHGNLEALEAVIKDAQEKDIGSAVCLGDFVGYGANPNECVQRIAGLPNVTSVLGNHDAAVIDRSQRDFFNPVAHAGIIFSEANTDDDSRNFLSGLPHLTSPGPDFIAVHSSPYMPEAWIYVLEPIEAADAFHVMDSPCAFIGHTHFPVVHSDTGASRPLMVGDRVKIQPGAKNIINVGSVGQPRDGDPRAAYLIYDDESKVAEFSRVEYDVDRAAEKILRAGLPPMLAHRIRRGY